MADSSKGDYNLLGTAKLSDCLAELVHHTNMLLQLARVRMNVVLEQQLAKSLTQHTQTPLMIDLLFK